MGRKNNPRQSQMFNSRNTKPNLFNPFFIFLSSHSFPTLLLHKKVIEGYALARFWPWTTERRPANSSPQCTKHGTNLRLRNGQVKTSGGGHGR